MTVETLHPFGLALCLMLCGCGDQTPAAWNATSARDASQAGYLVSPVVTSVSVGQAGESQVRGSAGAGTRLELVPIGIGTAASAIADTKGAWQVSLLPTKTVQQYALAASIGERTLPASDRLVLLPNGVVAILRPGLPSRVLGRSRPDLIQAVDFDRAGGAALSGAAAGNEGIIARVDRRPAGEARIGADGQFSMAVAAPLTPGSHLFDVASDSAQQSVSIVVSVPSSEKILPVEGGWRIDWQTPAGGYQATVILSR